ncbi:MAG TPA: protein phosphatase 2C domain-containing protein, partial [Flavisolibacter sp.]|nr:protein phosphatase 2C domain-containing protein [Flavisolibacter sp.]
MAAITNPFFGLTDTGKLRDNNEDAFIAERTKTGNLIVACVIDGVGGYEGGEVAAEIARKTVLEKLNNPSTDLISLMKEAVITSNQKIYSERIKNSDKQKMACVLTLAVVDLENNLFHYAHVGDTRLYLFRDQSLIKVTKDHSFVGFLEDSKRLSEDAAMRHPKRNEINKALGFDPNMASQQDYIETGQSPFLPGDMLLVCSDGLTDLVNSDSITSILSSKGSYQEKCKALIDAANKAGGKDNITVVLVQNDKKPVSQKATKPLLQKKKSVTGQDKAAVNEETVIAGTVKTVKRSGTTAIVILTLLCLLLTAGLIWLWMQKESGNEEPNHLIKSSVNEAEAKLVNALQSSDSSVFYIDSTYTSPVFISDTILINRDSLHINGNGVTLIRDSSFSGPAIVIDANSRFVLLENIVFKNFDVAILAPAKVLQLKNVRFVNCKIAVLAQLNFASDTVNTYLKDST